MKEKMPYSWRLVASLLLCACLLVSGCSSVKPNVRTQEMFVPIGIDESETTTKASNTPNSKYTKGVFTDTILLGDSIMVLSTAALKSAMPGITIEAFSGRYIDQSGDAEPEPLVAGRGVLGHTKDVSGKFKRYVIGTGNNEADGMSPEKAQEFVSSLPSDSDIFFVTEFSGNNQAGTANTNNAIQSVAGASNVHIIDWYGKVKSTADESWNSPLLCDDKIHPKEPDGTKEYAELVKQALDSIAGTGKGLSGNQQIVVDAAMSQLGVPYPMNGEDGEQPGVFMDCSGLVRYAYKQAGVDLGKLTSYQIADFLEEQGYSSIDPKSAVQGDILIWYHSSQNIRSDSHIAIVNEVRADGTISCIQATYDGVQIKDAWDGYNRCYHLF